MDHLRVTIFIATLLLASRGVAQELSPPQAQTGSNDLAFEVASVKSAATPGSGNCPGVLITGRFHCTGVTLKPLVLKAYGVSSDLLVGPKGLERDTYDIDAKAPQEVGNDRLNLLLQNLLVQRFGLVVHWETREMPIYELVVAKGGPKLKTPEKPTADSDAASSSDPGARPKMVPNKDGLYEFPPGVPGLFVTRANGAQWLTARMKSIAALLSMLRFQIGRPVVDKTGLAGLWDFNLRYSNLSSSDPGAAASGDRPPSGLDSPTESVPTLFEAFVTQLGLKLESAKGPVKVLVVDHVNSAPTEN